MKRVRRTSVLAAAAGLAVSGVFGCVADAQSIFNTQNDFSGWAVLGNNINPPNPSATNYNANPGGTVATNDTFDSDDDTYDGLGSVSAGSYANNGTFTSGSLQPGMTGSPGSMTATMNAQNAGTDPGSDDWEIGLSQNLMTNADAVAAAEGGDYFAVDVSAAPGNNAANSYFELELYETFNGFYGNSSSNPITSSGQVTNGSITTVYFADEFVDGSTTNFQLELLFNTHGQTNGAANATANFNLSIDNLRVVAPAWSAGSGNWNVAGNWTTGDTGYAPNYQGLEADFLNYVTANTTVTVSATTDIGTILFNDPNYSYTLAATGGGNLTMNMPGVEPALIDDRAGTDTISAPLKLATNTSLCVNVVNSGDVLHISGAISGAGGLNVNGASTLGLSDSGDGGTLASPTIGIGSTTNGLGTVSLESANSYGGGTTVAGGTLVIAAAGALPANSAVSITGGKLQFAHNTDPTGGETLSSLSISAGGALDLGNNHMIISDSGGSIDATIRAYLAAGYNGGGWNGASATSGTIITSALTSIGSGTYSIGYADGANNVVAGLPSGELEVAYTLAGDANLDGKVDSADFGILADNYGASGAVWDTGDFSYDGKVDSADFGILAVNYGQSAGSNADVVTEADWSALDAFAAANGMTLAQVPEPASTSLCLWRGWASWLAAGAFSGKRGPQDRTAKMGDGALTIRPILGLIF